MKSFQVIVLVVCGLLALVGLVVFATSKGFGGGGAEIGVVRIWGTLPQESVDTVLSELKAATKEYGGISYEEQPMGAFSIVLASAIAEGTGPDLILITQEQLLAEKNRITLIPFSTISERTYVDAYVPLSELFLTLEGTYGIPFLIDPLVLYYNKAILASAGVSSAPTSWEAVSGLAQNLTLASDGQRIVSRSVIPFGEYGNVGNARALLSLILFQAGSPITAEELGTYRSALQGRSTDGSSPAESAVNFYTQFANPAKTVYTWNRSLPLSTNAFTAGDLVLYPGFASEQPLLAAANPNLEFDMAPIPQPLTNENRTTYGLLYAFSIPKASANPGGALAAAFALSAPASSRTVATLLSMAPANRVALVPPENDRFAAIFYPEALIARGWLSPSPTVVDGIFAGMIANISSGRQSVSDALKAAADSLDAALQ